ncbi:L-threonine aldolase [Motilibacter peucedani]|uniref:L-threonine aldolase n=1 Tax=Motilibacter peucedani TaxID=598650 RepID=A0A420XSQ9_9ACTN|nr:low specificity L-threonine aldolase [Motilibacter peucedani]RKS77918.1 L-threonine aldolase [Motilibacter peucedani]
MTTDLLATSSPASSPVRRHDPGSRGFASDNYSGVHPEVLEAIAAANGGHQTSYGGDVYTAHLQDVFRGHFGPRAEVFPVFNGTGANVVSLQALTDRWASVVCAASAHIHVDESGAPEKVGGLKLLTVPTPDGKLTPELIDIEARGFDDEHRAQPQVVSITQTTELGTRYTVDEIAAICAHAHSKGMRVHLDGARISNAAAGLGVDFAAFTSEVGVDIVSFGGTKNGLMMGEVVVVLDPAAVPGMLWVRKSAMQLASKMRFISAQFDALLSGDLWLRNASHANAMATRLAEAVSGLPGLQVVRPVQANAVFAVLPAEVTQRLQERFRFYVWDEATGEVRWMTTFDTTEADIDAFSSAVRDELEAYASR